MNIFVCKKARAHEQKKTLESRQQCELPTDRKRKASDKTLTCSKVINQCELSTSRSMIPASRIEQKVLVLLVEETHFPETTRCKSFIEVSVGRLLLEEDFSKEFFRRNRESPKMLLIFTELSFPTHIHLKLPN